MWSLEAEGRSLIENMSFCRFSAGLRRPNRLAAVGGILVFGGLAQTTPHLNLSTLRPSIAAE
jgi:hypothetical protein